MTYFCGVKPQPFVNHLNQKIEPHSKVLVVTSTNGGTTRTGTYLGMRNKNPFVIVSYVSGGVDTIRTFEHKTGKIYPNE